MWSAVRWPGKRLHLSQIFLTPAQEVRPFWSRAVIVIGAGVLSLALLEILSLLLALQGVFVLRWAMGAKAVLWLSQHLP